MTNVDKFEVEKFNNIASEWWQKDGKFKPLHDLNPIRFEFINKHSLLHGQKVLDVGCGGGILTEALANADATVTGIDMAHDVIDVANKHKLQSRLEIEYLKTSAEDLAAIREQRYDVVTCMEMLEHVPSPQDVINACSTLVKPGGDVYFSTLNRTPKSFMLAIVGAEYLLKLLPRGTHSYEKLIKPSEMHEWCQQAGLIVKKIQGVSYNPFSGVAKLCSDVNVNYLVYAQKPEAQ